MILPTELLQKSVDEIMGQKQSNLVTVKLTLLNSEDPNYRLDDFILDQIKFSQEFFSNITDSINVSLNIKLDYLIELIKQQSGLYATLLIEYVDHESGQIIISEKPMIYTFKVFIHDLADLAKKYGINMIKNTDGTKSISEFQANTLASITLQLITEKSYLINKSGFVGMMNNVTVEDAIKYIASSMGVKKIEMTPVDNNSKYQHFHIPPMYFGFNIIFEFIQHYYGVYNAGLNYYFANDTLYVYPPFDMNAPRKPKLTIFKVAPRTFIGGINYHVIESDGDIRLVSNSDIIQQSLSHIAAENDGNSHLFLRSDQMIDGQVSGSKINDVAAATSDTADNSIYKGSAIPKYKRPTINVFDRVSRIAEGNTELIGLSWSYSRLFLLKPGMPITYVYDDENVVMSKKGLLESVIYTLQRSTNKGTSIIYSLNAMMLIRLSTDARKYEV